MDLVMVQDVEVVDHQGAISAFFKVDRRGRVSLNFMRGRTGDADGDHHRSIPTFFKVDGTRGSPIFTKGRAECKRSIPTFFKADGRRGSFIFMKGRTGRTDHRAAGHHHRKQSPPDHHHLRNAVN
jgi:hypothetical protein